MTRPRRRSRAVYRVCSEDEYLAGTDPFADWHATPAAEGAGRGRALRRLAGAAALTGAVGTVAGVVALAASRGHAVERREVAAARLVFSTPTAHPGPGSGAGPSQGPDPSANASTSAVRVTHRPVTHWSRPPAGHMEGREPVRVALIPARRIEASSAVEMPARAIAVSVQREAPAQDEAPARRDVPVQDAPVQQGAPPQSEFGFEH
jgi:hypothetical protein